MGKVIAFGIRYKPTGQWKRRGIPMWRNNKFSDVPSLYFRKCDTTQAINYIHKSGNWYRNRSDEYNVANYEVVTLEMEWREV